MKKEAGILFPISVLPSRFGIGDFGENAYYLIDQLNEAHISILQILPLQPLSYGNSPYQPLSSQAGDEIYLSLDELVRENLLNANEILPFNNDKDYVDYDAVRAYKDSLYKLAYSRFKADREYKEFASQDWVQQYALFKVFKLVNNNVEWLKWPEVYKNYLKRPTFSVIMLQKDIDYQIFLQYEFNKQWNRLKRYANRKGVSIIGDMPFYVGLDSSDVWFNQKDFLLDEEGQPIYIAGVPPDYFSKFGQRWGNPIYNWSYMKEHHFDFWINRLKYASRMYDMIRIDHFRAFDTYWQVPESETTAILGKWIEAPGYEFFDTLYKELPDIKILAEDLGDLRPEVYELRDHYHLQGMYVFQFHFNSKMDMSKVVVYTGTHDNDTLVGWLDLIDDDMKKELDELLADYDEEETYQKIIHYCLDSDASKVIIPIWDILGKDNSCRFNVPGKIGSPNWQWHLSSFKDFDKYFDVYKEMIKGSGR